jgi:hypothetical protein
MADDENTRFPLAKYDGMCAAIAAAYEVDEVKEIRDRAVALQAYAYQARNFEAEHRCCEVRLRAERKAGGRVAAPDGQGQGLAREPIHWTGPTR